MQQAEEKRLTMLKSKAQKAHDEEAKVSLSEKLSVLTKLCADSADEKLMVFFLFFPSK